MTCFQSSKVQFSCIKAHCNRAFSLFVDIIGFFASLTALRPCSISVRLTNLRLILSSLRELMIIVASTVILVPSLVTKRVKTRLSQDVNLCVSFCTGCDAKFNEFFFQYFKTVDLSKPQIWATSCSFLPSSSRVVMEDVWFCKNHVNLRISKKIRKYL